MLLGGGQTVAAAGTSAEAGRGGNAFVSFFVYVCVALLLRFRSQILALNSPDLLLRFLQNLPTTDWTVKDVEMLASQAYVYQSMIQTRDKQSILQR